MKRGLWTLLTFAGLMLWHTAASAADAPRFTTVGVYLDTSEPVAAWQFEFGKAGGGMTIVGVENGESAAFGGAPYYDREAVRSGRANRIIVADYSLAEPGELPSGRIRIATLHVMLEGTATPDFHLHLVKAVAPDGRPIRASITLRSPTGGRQ